MRKLARVLSAADDMLEVALILGFKVIRKTWLPVATIGLLAFAGMQSLEWRMEPPLPEFQVVEHDCCVSPQRALIRHDGAEYSVRPGSVVPAQDPKLVITDVGDGVVRAMAIGSWSPMIERIPAPARRTIGADPVSVVAIAGEEPEYIAVIEVQKETYIVQEGTLVPCDHAPAFQVVRVGSDRVTFRRVGSRELHSACLPFDLPPELEP